MFYGEVLSESERCLREMVVVEQQYLVEGIQDSKAFIAIMNFVKKIRGILHAVKAKILGTVNTNKKSIEELMKIYRSAKDAPKSVVVIMGIKGLPDPVAIQNEEDASSLYNSTLRYISGMYKIPVDVLRGQNLKRLSPEVAKNYCDIMTGSHNDISDSMEVTIGIKSDGSLFSEYLFKDKSYNKKFAGKETEFKISDIMSDIPIVYGMVTDNQKSIKFCDDTAKMMESELHKLSSVPEFAQDAHKKLTIETMKFQKDLFNRISKREIYRGLVIQQYLQIVESALRKAVGKIKKKNVPGNA